MAITLYRPPTFWDWQNYSMTIGATTTPPTKGVTSLDRAQWKRNGADMNIKYDYIQTAITGSANGSGAYLFPIPGGYTIDTTKFSTLSYNGNTAGVVGYASVTGGSINKGSVNVYDATNLIINIGNETNIFQPMSSSFQNMNQATLTITIIASIPITGWTINN